MSNFSDSEVNPDAIFVNNEIIRQIQEQLRIVKAEITKLNREVSILSSGHNKFPDEVLAIVDPEISETVEVRPKRGRPKSA